MCTFVVPLIFSPSDPNIFVYAKTCHSVFLASQECGHHTGPNSCQQHTCPVQHHGIATHQANSAMLIFNMQPLTVGGSPRHQLLNLQFVCHPHRAQTAWTIPNV